MAHPIVFVLGLGFPVCFAEQAKWHIPACQSDTTSVLQVKSGADEGVESPDLESGRGSRLIVKNECAETLWIASMFRDQDRHMYPANVKLTPGEAFTYNIPSGRTVASTRFWPKMGCNPDGTNCRLGSSGGPGQDCPRHGCAPPVDTKFEATFHDFNTAEPVDWFDTSGVDGYTLPYSLELDSNCPHGKSLDCSGLSLADCPTDEVLNGQWHDLHVKYDGIEETVGCFSHCGKLTYTNWGNSPTWAPQHPMAQMYCCPTPPVSPLGCRLGPVESTKYVRLFREKCKGVYSYAYDDAVGLQTCPIGTTYTWTLYCSLWRSPNSTRIKV